LSSSGIGSSLIFEKNVERQLEEMGIEAEVRAVAEEDLGTLPPAQLILVTGEVLSRLSAGNSELITIRNISDSAEIQEALFSALG